MAEESKSQQEEQVTLGQKLFDNVWVLLAAGLLTPGVLYLAWSLFNIANIK
jgi:hypothetical protein